MTNRTSALAQPLEFLQRVSKGQWFEVYQPVILILLSALIFTFSINGIDLRGMNDLGLVAVLPFSVYLALGIIGLSFVLTMNRPVFHDVILLFHIVVLAFMLHGITIPLEEVPRFNVTWRHAGVIDYILRTGHVDPRIDAYFNWPGFFILNAFFIDLSGLSSALPYASFTPVVFNLMYLGPVALILASATDDKRLVWLGMWFFLLGNWIGQDYFSPQGMSYFFYLAIVGILLKWFHVRSKSDSDVRNEAHASENPVRRVALLAVILFALAYSVASHQLTPFAVLLGIFALTVVRRVTLRRLWLIAAMMILIWMGYMAVTFLKGNLSGILAGIGQLEEAIALNVTTRLQGSPGHVTIVRIRLIITLAVWGLAFFGWLRRIQRNIFDSGHEALAVAPFLLFSMQFYGGEMLLRVYLFALPFMAFFAAAFFFTEKESESSWRKTAVIGLLSAILLGSFYLVRYGNEKSDQFTRNEVAAVEYLYETAKPGALLVAPSPHYSIKYRNYEAYPQRFISKLILETDIPGILNVMKGREEGAYLTITQSQESYFQIFYNYPPERWPVFEQRLLDTGSFDLIYSNEDARIYQYKP